MSVDFSIDEFARLGLSEKEAGELVERLRRLPTDTSPEKLWDLVTSSILYPEHPFAVHNYLYELICRRSDDGPAPAWTPPGSLRYWRPESGKSVDHIRGVPATSTPCWRGDRLLPLLFI